MNRVVPEIVPTATAPNAAAPTIAELLPSPRMTAPAANESAGVVSPIDKPNYDKIEAEKISTSKTTAVTKSNGVEGGSRKMSVAVHDGHGEQIENYDFMRRNSVRQTMARR